MQQNFSPWIQELDRQRIAAILQEHMDGEVAVIGGGIAGMTTAYYLLRETSEHVTLIEADRIAHGATGHN
ncbi:FAD-binding oxidoreductase, partial [Candidatus Gracilibacteria bacterium]|nr:FAD-binding oxidoreductase [Candidatus Gracilibacteria bacterium]